MLIRTDMNILPQLWDIKKWCHCTTDSALSEAVVITSEVIFATVW